MKRIHLLLAAALAALVLCLDRVTKSLALTDFITPKIVTNFLYFELTFNRGVSLGLFNFSNSFLFSLLTGLITLVIAVLAYYSYKRYRDGFAIYGELLVLAGALSNLLDRFIYGSVVDFIRFHLGNFGFPYFNIADAAVVAGIGYMFFTILFEDAA